MLRATTLSATCIALLALQACGAQAMRATPTPLPRPAAPAPALQDPPGELDADSLDGLVAFALGNAPAVEAAWQHWRALLERPAQVSALPDPRLTYRHFLEEVETRVGPQEQALGVSQMLPWFGKRGLRGEAATAEAEAARQRYQAAALQAALDVREAWYELYHLRRSVEVVRRARQLFEALEPVLRTRYSAGEAGYADLLRAQVELDRLTDRLRTLEDSGRPARARLNAALGRPPDAALPEPDEVEVPEEAPPDALVLELLRTNNPELEAATRRIQAQDAALRLARSERWPDLTLGLEWIDTGEARMPGVAGSGDDPLIASLSLNLPVWSGRHDALEEEARARRRALVLERQTSLLDLEARASARLYELRDALRRIALYEATLLPRARQALEALEAAFRGGRAGFLDLVDAERTLLDFELALARARADAALAQARLERITGAPRGGAAELEERDAPGEER